ncbi:MAG: hypothetical protein HFH24_12870 [Ruminococcus sp.]|nr:hypothetical protein [Ruminococcus sp.]
MEDLTFGEQVKIILNRRGMTIKELAEQIQERTGKAMSRQNLTQRLGRDNFQEKDMRMIAAILGCPFHLSIFPIEALDGKQPEPLEEVLLKYVKNPRVQSKKKKEEDDAYQQVFLFEQEAEGTVESVKATEPEKIEEPKRIPAAAAKARVEEAVSGQEEERDITIGEIYELHEELNELEDGKETEEIKRMPPVPREHGGESKSKGTKGFDPVIHYEDAPEDLSLGEMNPYTGREYQTNSVRMHPSRIGYVQVYDRAQHGWTDMTEWAFLGYQERKKALLGRDYEPPIYLD